MTDDAMPFALRYSATIRETVAGLGIGRTTLYEAITRGEVESFCKDRRRLVVVQSAIAWVRGDNPPGRQEPGNNRPCG